MKKWVIIGLLLISGIGWAQDEELTIVSYNMLNFPDGRDDCSNNTVVEQREDTLRKIMDYLQPDILGACEIQTQEGVDRILNGTFNVDGQTHFAAAAFQKTSDLNNALFYNTEKLVLKEQHVIESFPRNIDHYVLYVKDPNLDVYFDTTFIDVYMVHLKAGNSYANQEVREGQVLDMMAHAANQPEGRNIFIGGDMNTYSSSDLGYQAYINSENNIVDPLDQPGNWHLNTSFAEIHSQSTRKNENYDCGATGGMDDRFDHILVSENVMNNTDNVKYIEGSYRAVGNDGNHYNKRLIDGANTMYPEEIAHALYYMSDHLPIELKVEITFPTSNGLALVPDYERPSCHGMSDGWAKVIPHQGEPPYTYQWDENANFQTTQIAVDLPAGEYCVTVTDNWGEEDQYCISISEPEKINHNALNVADYGDCSGGTEVFVAGGTPPYSFQWEDFPELDTNKLVDVCGGEYALTIIDDNECEKEVMITIPGTSGLANEKIHAQLYPNPVKDEAYLSVSEPVEYILVYDELGRAIEMEVQTTAKNKYKLNTESIAAGIYIIRVLSKSGKVFDLKLIKE